MPKVISRAAISSSDQAPATASSLAVLRTFYCLCGEFMLVIDRGLDKLPRRKTDGAFIVRCKDGKDLPLQAARKFKLNAKLGKQCLVKRKESPYLEARTPLLCSRCNTTVAYQTTPPPIASGTYLYIVRGGLTEQQGRIPADAFEGEERVALSERDLQIRAELAAIDEKLNSRMDEATRRKLENDRKNVVGGGTVEEVVERQYSPGI
ncbi:hypothetical protein NliqN6_0778 [Naganishia liquefaciens]|uniref:STEEP1 domain-containing protein n=1 Tax=Naganishia liquefaciens TaxID=104408 RepID=A0A8H3TNG3_9TREE|nr:hypothetical protein NliqN6_0778 [Naganishia liquefaciens]